ncbi:MAG: DUF2252 family protein [Planctomycetaceae bacterium]
MGTDFVEATMRFEAWLRGQIALQENELDYKHAQMADKDSAFPFFRGTYYRWAEGWPELCPEVSKAPAVLGVGDLHVENFGTWRDQDGRLVWGINDFDEADDLSFTNDLVRLAASAIVGASGAEFGLSPKKTCRAILSGYVVQLERGGEPFVLEEENLDLRQLATSADREPVQFWKKLTELLKDPIPHVPTDVVTALNRDFQRNDIHFEIRLRPKVGMGSLGKPRFVGMANLMGGWIAREAKAVTQPATAMWSTGRASSSRVEEILSRATRCPDPFLRVDGSWIVRRLAPRCSRIELEQLDNIEDEQLMFESMGAETANIHCGSKDARDSILQWLDAQESNWLEEAAQTMVKSCRDDWKTWRKAWRKK